MPKTWKFLPMFIITLSSFIFADVFITELTDPQNSSTAGRYVELYNNGDADIDLSTGWSLLRWTNDNDDPQSPRNLSGTIAAGGFYIVCNDATKYNETFGLVCDQDVGTGGVADSNGDDNIALTDDTGAIVDMFGVAGEDGSGTGHEFEDGRAERANGVCNGSPVWDENEWNIDNDSGGGDGNQYAPEGFDAASWIGSDYDCGSEPTCDDESACNYGMPGDCEYVNVNWGNLQWPFSTTINAGATSESIFGQVYVEGVSGSGDPESGIIAELGYGTDSPDDSWTWSSSSVNGNSGNNDEFGGTLTIDDAGTYSYTYRYRYNSSCWYYASEIGTITVNALTTYAVTFNVDMNFQEVDAENGVRLFGLVSWDADDAMTMSDDDLDGVYSTTVDLTSGDYQFKYRNGWAYENVDDLSCASQPGDYWNRDLSVSDSDITMDVNCFGACDACVGGCMDPNADNYNPDANTDDGSCEYAPVEPDNIFFSECAEGSSNNKYLEIYNATDSDVDLSGYSLSSCSNGCNGNDEEGWSWQYPDNVTFEAGTMLASGDVYVVCHGSADDLIQAECDQTFTYLSNGDDVFGLTQIGTGTILDIIGTIGPDPGSGWEVAGVSNATKDHTLVRDAVVSSGNDGNWAESAGDADNSEWFVLDQNTWDYLGSHPHDMVEIVYINATFNVNMSEQTVDTDGYGLDLYIDGSYHDMFDDDGDDIWSATVSLIENTTYSYKYKNGVAWEGNFNDLGCGDGDDYGNRTMTTGDSDMTLDPFCFNSCTDCESSCGSGDTNDDGALDVLDVVITVEIVLGTTPPTCNADLNNDGNINVQDVVILVENILGSRGIKADKIEIIFDGSDVLFNSNGYVGAFQMTLSHNNSFELDLTNNALVSKYNTIENVTTLIIVSPETEHLFTTKGHYVIEEVIAATTEGYINVEMNMPLVYSISSAYPNPFNPSTNISIDLNTDAKVNISVYNTMGQLMDVLVNDNLNAGSYPFVWNATNVPSGLYLIKTDVNSTMSTQKVLLLK